MLNRIAYLHFAIRRCAQLMFDYHVLARRRCLNRALSLRSRDFIIDESLGRLNKQLHLVVNEILTFSCVLSPAIIKGEPTYNSVGLDKLCRS